MDSMTAEATRPAGTAMSAVERRRSLVATGVGNLLEWFDWAVYAVFSTYISAALFSKEDPVSALLGTLAVFAVGFVMRPLGGFVFGRLADKKGRKWVLLVTMLMMAAGSLVIALIPSYETIGGFASILLLLARLIQGFAHGGESTASNVYLPEIAPHAKRALYGSTVAVAMGGGTLIATLFGTVLAQQIEASAMGEWGWRIPFFFGALLAIVVLWLRRNMMESEVHTEHVSAVAAAAKNATTDPGWTRGQIAKRAVEVFFYMAGTTLPYYIWSSYAAVYAISQQGMEPGPAFAATLGATVLNICLVPVMGWISDRIGRRIPVIFYNLATAALTFPMFGLISSDPWTLFAAQSIMMGISACIGGTQPAMISEQVPTKYRMLIMGTAMPLAVALFGGTAPYLNTWFTSAGNGWLFNLYMIAVCLGSAAVVWRWKEIKGIDLRDVR
ncbi:MFS transporter [Arthrobacter mangrovi]|uniref:MFS transporter n=1 Tax=Arthrobacter mangrovi TaxID=2966350 RepID=A0ABQ5MYW2_9MICC|nr:MFS transporter [Arthrobacter mangrovi]GLB69153.1 MFS transporter [Arthrobacter mangrovi]